MLAVGLARASIEAGYRTYYTTAADLVARCHRAALEGRWATTMRFFAGPRLLVIDEVGYLPLQSEAAAALFQVITQRYLKSSIVMTTNLGVSSWGKIFDDPMVAAAMLDRLLAPKRRVQHRRRELPDALTPGALRGAPQGGDAGDQQVVSASPHRVVTWGISLIDPGEFPKSPALAAIDVLLTLRPETAAAALAVVLDQPCDPATHCWLMSFVASRKEPATRLSAHPGTSSLRFRAVST